MVQDRDILTIEDLLKIIYVAHQTTPSPVILSELKAISAFWTFYLSKYNTYKHT